MGPAQEVHIVVGKRNRMKNGNCGKRRHALTIHRVRWGSAEAQVVPRFQGMEREDLPGSFES